MASAPSAALVHMHRGHVEAAETDGRPDALKSRLSKPAAGGRPGVSSADPVRGGH